MHRDNLAAFLELCTDAFLKPAFDEDDFERVRSDAINAIENTLRYSSDEELGKAALYERVFRGTPYAHLSEGTVAGLQSITLDDVKTFYRAHFTRDNVRGRHRRRLRRGGRRTARSGRAAIAGRHAARRRRRIDAQPVDGRSALLVEKPGADAAISFGFPIDVRRGSRDFYALWIANSWLGEHRNQSSHLYQVIREMRGMNYGDYSYIEAFPNGGERTMPPVNVPRRRQMFEVWIRTLPDRPGARSRCARRCASCSCSSTTA